MELQVPIATLDQDLDDDFQHMPGNFKWGCRVSCTKPARKQPNVGLICAIRPNCKNHYKIYKNYPKCYSGLTNTLIKTKNR